MKERDTNRRFLGSFGREALFERTIYERQAYAKTHADTCLHWVFWSRMNLRNLWVRKVITVELCVLFLSVYCMEKIEMLAEHSKRNSCRKHSKAHSFRFFHLQALFKKRELRALSLSLKENRGGKIGNGRAFLAPINLNMCAGEFLWHTGNAYSKRSFLFG